MKNKDRRYSVSHCVDLYRLLENAPCYFESGVSRFPTVISSPVFAKSFALTMPISLHTITVSNFKSFSGKVTIGPLKSFTAIIGPNGSGKSNIMDAISFVVGEKPSALRVNRLSKLIHGRLAIGEPMKDSTYVTAVFKIDDKTEKSFTRKIYGEINQYKIDDKVKFYNAIESADRQSRDRFNGIIEKIVTSVTYIHELQEIGLNIKTGNFLIPQNYIECLAVKMPKDLTAMFEQISNSFAYKADYERLKLELFQMEEEGRFEHQIKKQLLLKKKYATAEKIETEKYLQLREKYNEKKLKFQLIRLLLIKEEAESLQDEEKKIKSQINEYLRDKKAAILILERIQSNFKSSSNDVENIEQDILKMENIIQQKKIKNIVFEEKISYWEKKRNCARVSLDNASKARDINKRIIQELKDELIQIDNKLTQLKKEIQTDTIALSNSQVKRYMELTTKAECRAKDFIYQINSLMRDQQKDHDKLDNENRRKQELESKVKQIKLKKGYLEKLQDLNAEFKATLKKKEAKIQELKQKIAETKNKLFAIENDIVKISEELSQADIDNSTISRQVKRNETIKMLKQFNGVYGRLCNLCKPIHSRYNVAITKVFGKYTNAIVVSTRRTAMECIQFLKEQKMGIEIFLPLDSIENIFLNERLRTIKKPKNIKLLYDLLNISSPEISKAVLFVTKNTLVCETMEDATILAYKSDAKQAYDCVSLDGCFYRKDGIISSGLTDLIAKAKQWGELEILTLKERKAQLMQESRNLSNTSSVIQFELDEITLQIEGLKSKNKYVEADIKNAKDEIVKYDEMLRREELDMLDEKIIALNMVISKIQDNIKKRIEEIESTKERVNAIKNKIFANFCQDINVPDIDYYEKNNLRIYQQQQERQMELEQQYNRIKNQLDFENENDTESKVLKWQCAVEQAEAELNKVIEQEHHAKIKIEQENTKMLKLKDNSRNMKKDLENEEKKLTQCKSQIDVIGKCHLESQKAYITVQKKIEQKRIECNTILKECKMEDLIIPMVETSHRRSESFFTSSSSNAESSSGCKVLTKIDFLQFPENICHCTTNDLKNMAKQLNAKLTNIQKEVEYINPNLNIYEKIDLITQQLQKTDMKLRDCRTKCDKIKKQFNTVKAKRYKSFSDCLEFVFVEIDSIYKNLLNDTSAQAIIVADNPEEPYIGNIIYNCIVPSKSFHPMQYLSGGEKTLASLALIFAIQRYKQVPFLIMDEGDAALDNTNIKNVIRFIQSQRDTMQIIVISLHNTLFLMPTYL